MKKLLFFLLLPFLLSAQVEGAAAFALTSGGAEVDFLSSKNPDIDIQPFSIVSADLNEGTAITEWSNTNASGSPDGVPGVSPEIHEGTAGSSVQCSCIAANDDWLNFGQSVQYRPDLGDKSMWIVIIFGDFISGSSNSVFSQAGATDTDRAFDIGLSGGTIYGRFGGTLNITSYNPTSNNVIVYNLGGTTYDMWADGSKEVDASTAMGTGYAAANINLCARNNGDLNTTSDIQRVVMKTGETLSASDITTIFATYQINSLWWLLLIAPTFYKRKIAT